MLVCELRSEALFFFCAEQVHLLERAADMAFRNKITQRKHTVAGDRASVVGDDADAAVAPAAAPSAAKAPAAKALSAQTADGGLRKGFMSHKGSLLYPTGSTEAAPMLWRERDPSRHVFELCILLNGYEARCPTAARTAPPRTGPAGGGTRRVRSLVGGRGGGRGGGCGCGHHHTHYSPLTIHQ